MLLAQPFRPSWTEPGLSPKRVNRSLSQALTRSWSLVRCRLCNPSALLRPRTTPGPPASPGKRPTSCSYTSCIHASFTFGGPRLLSCNTTPNSSSAFIPAHRLSFSAAFPKRLFLLRLIDLNLILIQIAAASHELIVSFWGDRPRFSQPMRLA